MSAIGATAQLLVLLGLASCDRVPEADRAPGPDAQRASAVDDALPAWTCADPTPGSCPWDCTGPGLRPTSPGTWYVDLTADCTLRLRAWGGGGGGGAMEQDALPKLNSPSGGGGGGTSVLTHDGSFPGLPWVVGGGGGAGGVQGRDLPGGGGGGGGGGGYAEIVADFRAGQRLILSVGGGGLPGCDNIPGDGGGPAGGRVEFPFEVSIHGGGWGGYTGYSIFGGGASANGYSIYGGGGGEGADSHCGVSSKYGRVGGCEGPNREGGGGGGGGGAGQRVVLGTSGRGGHEGGTGGAGGGAPLETPSSGIGAPFTIGHGGDGGRACGVAGDDGRLELAVEPAGSGVECPVDRVVACDGACVPSDHHGDGVCDASLDCPLHARDWGDCPESGRAFPDWMAQACPNVTAQDAFCLTMHLQADTRTSTLLLVGLDDGAQCSLGEFDWRYGGGDQRTYWQKFAWPRPHRDVYLVGYIDGMHRTVERIDLQDRYPADVPWINTHWYEGHSDYTTNTAFGAGFVMENTDAFSPANRWFHSFDEVALGGWEDLPLPEDPDCACLEPSYVYHERWYCLAGIDGDLRACAYDLKTGARLPAVHLDEAQPYPKWRTGMAVAAGRVWVTEYDHAGLPRLVSFDLLTGSRGIEYPLWYDRPYNTHAWGLACVE